MAITHTIIERMAKSSVDSQLVAFIALLMIATTIAIPAHTTATYVALPSVSNDIGSNLQQLYMYVLYN